jgi:hypothetical protein
MTAFLWGNRLLPYPVEGRADPEINLFFSVWACTLRYVQPDRPGSSSYARRPRCCFCCQFSLHSPRNDRYGTAWFKAIDSSSVWISRTGRLHCSMPFWRYGPAGPSRSAQAYGKQARFDRGRARERAARITLSLLCRARQVLLRWRLPSIATNRYHRQVAAADHDASPSNGRSGCTVFCAQHSVLRRMLIFAPGRRRMSDLILPIKVQGRAGW